MEPATVVIDNGTGYTKMGYAGNLEPSYIIPSVIATSLKEKSGAMTNNLINPELDFYIGDEALTR
jgi:actin-related protein 3